jgi:GT2 family glycosyltransferase
MLLTYEGFSTLSPLMVSILITTFNSAAVLKRCLESALNQDIRNHEVIVVDNASTDGTRGVLREFEDRVRVIYNDTNRGFAGGQNQAISYAQGEWLLSLNPDVLLGACFISKLLAAAEGRPRVGVICGKLLRWNPAADEERTNVVDSTGIYFLRNLRHLDRGSGEVDKGQYNVPEYVFGATGAAALYRRAMIEDISVGGEFFDEDFFAYREDADVAWRAQLMGWSCLYTPDAIAWHVRRVTPERFRDLPDEINRHSIKNRFLMRAKNVSLMMYLRLFITITVRDFLIVGYSVLFNPGLLSGLALLWSKRQLIREKRRWIQSHRRAGDRELLVWFANNPRTFPLNPDNGTLYAATASNNK